MFRITDSRSDDDSFDWAPHDRYRFQSHYVIASFTYALSILLYIFFPHFWPAYVYVVGSLYHNVCSVFDIIFIFASRISNSRIDLFA